MSDFDSMFLKWLKEQDKPGVAEDAPTSGHTTNSFLFNSLSKKGFCINVHLDHWAFIATWWGFKIPTSCLLTLI